MTSSCAAFFSCNPTILKAPQTARRFLRGFKLVLQTMLWVLVWLPLSHGAEYQSYRLDNNTLQITTNEGIVQISAYGDSAFETWYQPTGLQQLPSFAISETATNSALVLETHEDFLSLNAGKISAVITKSPFQISYYRGTKLLLAEESGLVNLDGIRGFRFQLQEHEKLIGGGQRILGMDRRGQAFPLYNKAHYGYTTESSQMYFGLPAVMSSQHYSLIFDNSASGFMDLGKSLPDVMQFGAVSGRTAYIVVAGNNYSELVKNTAELTGKQPLPPRWALGNFASRFGYHSEQEVRDTAQKFIDEGFPLDAIVLDLYWFGKDIKGHMGNLEWDKEAFPTPKSMISDLRDQGIKTILITEPFILSNSKRWKEAVQNNVLAKDVDGAPKQFDFYFGNTGLIDVFNQQASQWFSGIYTNLYKQGVAGWWGDLGEPEVHPSDSFHQFNDLAVSADDIHNVYGHMWAKRVYDNQRIIAPKQRPFIMMRSGFMGSQRYGMIPWTGDVSRSWDGLKPQVELSLQMGLLGLGYTHSDLGGFAGGEVFDQELFLRWLQYGVFQPVFRPHGQEEIAPEPIFHDEQTKDILREHIKLRYAMLPYNYSLAYENSLTGMPLMRPVFFEDEGKPQLIDIKDSYFWGKALLVKPITEPGLATVTVDLPAGRWFNFWSDEDFDGLQTIELKNEIDRIPVMVRAGSFLPMVQPVQSTDDYSTRLLDLHYYSDASVKSAKAVMYEDDGINPDAIKLGEYETLSFSAKQQNSQLQISLNRQGKYKGMPTKREMRLIVHNWLRAPLQAQKEIKKLNPDAPDNIAASAADQAISENGQVSEQTERALGSGPLIETATPEEVAAAVELANTTQSIEPSENGVAVDTQEPTTKRTSPAPVSVSLPVNKPAPMVVVGTVEQSEKPAPITNSLPLLADLRTLDHNKNGMYWEETTNTLYLKFIWQHNIQLVVKQSEIPPPEPEPESDTETETEIEEKTETD
ncbi:glycoside hydrolase family 31 protein [Paraglaciecola hydrolytica]|uniref:Glycosyl hydrolase n=1 Tax=Paraglaciecola hydrolytica TaxID=1799789 RepID=A0A136A616_9ALTE|nr:TIM-barrel domain-containing protein [Paraglaciecola hydrolytica]KXI30672.1 glycosyl hydrolase [Paraglaciecola hydrolytica]